MALSTSAKDAEDAADGFTDFRRPLPDHAAEVTGLISDLYAISSSLTAIETLSQDVLYRRNWARIQPDIELLRKSLKYTLDEIFDHFRRLDGTGTPDSYRRVWMSLERTFWDESQYALSTRLLKYKTFLRETTEVMKDRPSGLPLLVSSRNSLRNLLALQEQRILSQFGRLSVNNSQPPARPPSRPQSRPSSRPPSRPSSRPPSRPPSRGNVVIDNGRPPSRGHVVIDPPSPVSDRDRRRRRSFERVRPSHLSPQSPLSPSSGTFSDSIPPSVPEAPSSPLTGSGSAGTANSQSTQNDAIQYHWVREVFSSYNTNTAIPDTTERAGCFDEPQVNIKQILKEQGFEKILQLAFNDTSEMNTYFYLRDRDHRARIVCKVPHRSRPSELFCLPLNMLEVVQAGCCLQLCRRRKGGRELVLWARLKFTTLESMVVFFCSFLALRSQDGGRPVEDIKDHELDEEEELYGGTIDDDSYTHALRVYQHKTTGAVRLQASVHKGDMDRTPVWTAFITHLLDRSRWLKSLDSRTIAVRDLKLTIFMSPEDYSPPSTARGEHILKFTSRRGSFNLLLLACSWTNNSYLDAESFLDMMEELA
ncbi:hypothetical protein N7493_004597 [Penicillium malachiteum]|uniref:Uncharacterized protein n=1 Tax=Penicillium malachiteum TaxID=1324776 RepID=A0AAD6HNV5_9EURO|nr:hypothetical protein N7493_004597 [Penicillium malachiteum]